MARLELGAGNMAAAIPHLEAHLADNPNDAVLWLKLGKAVRATTGVAGAMLVMRRALSTVPDNPHLWHFYSGLVSTSGGPRQASQVLRDAIRRCCTPAATSATVTTTGSSNSTNKGPIASASARAALFCAAAVAEVQQRNYKQAFSHFESAVEADRTDAVTYQKWAAMNQERGRFDQARYVYETAIKNVPKSSLARLYSAYASMEAKRRRVDSARQLYRQAALANPHDRLVWQQWACLEGRANNSDRARQLFERAVLADPTYAISWQSWGLLEQRLGNVDAARALFERGTLADPDDPVCWTAWASLEAKEGNIVDARRLFEQGASRVLDKNNNNFGGGSVNHGNRGHTRATTPLFISWARFEESIGEVDLARFRLKTALNRSQQRMSDRIIVTHTLAGLEHRAGNVDEARSLFGSVLTFNRRDFRALYAWAMMELELFQTESAYKLLKRCVRINPRDARSVQALASLECEQYLHAGGLQRARALIKRALGPNKRPPSTSPMTQFWASIEKQYGDPEVAAQLLLQ